MIDLSRRISTKQNEFGMLKLDWLVSVYFCIYLYKVVAHNTFNMIDKYSNENCEKITEDSMNIAAQKEILLITTKDGNEISVGSPSIALLDQK